MLAAGHGYLGARDDVDVDDRSGAAVTEPLFPDFHDMDLREPPRVIADLSRINGWMLADIIAILIGLIVLVTPGHSFWLYAVCFFATAAFAVTLNLEIRLAMRGVKP